MLKKKKRTKGLLVAPKAIKITVAIGLALRILGYLLKLTAIIAGLNITETTVKQIANSDTAAKVRVNQLWSLMLD